MKRNLLEPNRYDYLSTADSTLYDLAQLRKMTLEEACLTIEGMLVDKAKASRAAHAACKR